MTLSNLFIGLLPAAGFATRLQRPGSKACLAITPEYRAADCLLRAYQAAKPDYALWLHREAQQDIRQHYTEHFGDLALRYRTIAPTPSTVHTLAHALRSAPQAQFLLGFPDIQFKAINPFDSLRQLNADIALGLFRTQRPDKVDMVAVNAHQEVTALLIKPTAACELEYCWALACWGPRFSAFLLNDLAHSAQHHGATPNRERYLGDVIINALQAGLSVKAQALEPNEPLLDIGTPEDYQQARAYWSKTH